MDLLSFSRGPSLTAFILGLDYSQMQGLNGLGRSGPRSTLARSTWKSCHAWQQCPKHAVLLPFLPEAGLLCLLTTIGRQISTRRAITLVTQQC